MRIWAEEDIIFPTCRIESNMPHIYYKETNTCILAKSPLLDKVCKSKQEH